MAHEFVIKNGFISKGDSIVSGSLSGETLNLTNSLFLNNLETQVLVRNNTTGLVEYRDASTFSGASGSNTFVTGTTFGSNQSLTRRNDGTDVLILTGGTNVTLSNPSSNQIKIDVNIPAGMNTYVTGFTYNDNNTFTIFDNDGGSFPATFNQVSGLTVNGDITVTGTSNLNAVTATTLDGNTILSGGTNLITIIESLDTNTFVSGGTYNDTTNNINFSGNSTETTFDVDLTNLVSSVSGNTFVVGGTYVDSTNTIALLRNDGNFVNVTGVTNTYVTGGTVSVPATDNSNGGTIGLFYKDSDGTPRTLPFEDTYTSGTTFASNQTTLTRNDGTEIFKLSGGTNVTLSNPSTNQIKLDVTIPSGSNTFVTGFTYDDINTFTISDNMGSAFTASINVLSATTISATTYYGDGSNLTGVGGGSSIRNVSSTDTFATANETINCTSGTFIVNLPTAIGIQGTTYTLVNSGTGTITMKGTLGQTINGSTTIDLKRQYISRTVQSDNSNWIVI